MTHDQRGVLAHGLLVFAVTCGLALVIPHVGIVTAVLFLIATVALARLCWKWIWLFNLVTALGLVGIASAVGARVSPNALLVTFTLVAFYDIVAVYGTGHMMRVFRALASRKILLAFVLTPLSPRTLAEPVSKATAYLGTGDVALPAMLIVATGRHGFAVVLGSMAGYALTVALHARRPMPAFPPIALGATVLYLLSLILVP